MSLIFLVPFLMLILVFALVFLDRRRVRGTGAYRPFISFVVPTYNDAPTVADTLRSIVESYDRLEIFVVDDRSTDDSISLLRMLQHQIPFTLLENSVNLGKSRSVNTASLRTKGEIIFFVDSDLVLTREAVSDVLRHFEYDPRVAAVSCPYRPRNSGFFPTMQAIEYNAARLIKQAQNSISVLGLWGGCLAVRRLPFNDVRQFSVNAILEDVDLALKLYARGYRTEQSSIPVETHVPASWREWVRQKMRWTSGGAQCFLRYPLLYLKNPIQMLFHVSSLLLTASLIFYLVSYIVPVIYVMRNIGVVVSSLEQFGHFVGYLWSAGRDGFLRGLFIKFGLMLFTVPYVMMLIRSRAEVHKLLFVVPYAFFYSPAYACVALFGWARGFNKFWTLREKGARAW